MATKKNRSTRATPPSLTEALAPASPISLAKQVTGQLVVITTAWSEVRRIAQEELTRLAGK